MRIQSRLRIAYVRLQKNIQRERSPPHMHAQKSGSIFFHALAPFSLVYVDIHTIYPHIPKRCPHIVRHAHGQAEQRLARQD